MGSATLLALGLAVALLGALLLVIELGRRIGTRAMAGDPVGAQAGAGVVDAAVFGLLGLLVAFTFSGAATRFDVRRQLVVEEANAIGTAYLRLDVLPAAAQPALRARFREYLESRLAAYRAMPDMAAVEAELARTTRLQEEIWRRAVAACGEPGVAPSTSTLVLPALNAMIDIVTTRTVAAQTHQPVVIFAMLFALMLVGALLVGYGMSGVPSRNWVHMIGFALAVTVVMYVILDLEFPRVGLIRLDRFDRLLEELRPTMK
jgi:hypothetical protein